MQSNLYTYDPNKVYARIGAKAVISNTKGQLLVLKRSQKTSRPGGWDFPVGGMDFGENPVDGVRREIFEETGLNMNVFTLKMSWSEVNEIGEYIVILGFEGIATSADVHISGEHTEYAWMDIAQVAQLTLPSFHRKLLETVYID